MPIITTAELASYLRTTEASEMALVVELAEGIVSEVWTAGTSPAPARVRAITLEVAARAWRNPEGYSSETVDDYTYRRDADTRAAGIYLTDAERAALLGLNGTGYASAFSMPVYMPQDIP